MKGVKITAEVVINQSKKKRGQILHSVRHNRIHCTIMIVIKALTGTRISTLRIPLKIVT